MWCAAWLGLSLMMGTAEAEELALADALQRALEHNLELASARLERQDVLLSLQAAAGDFDPNLSAGLSVSGARSPTNQAVDGADFINNSTLQWDVGLSQALPTGGSVDVRWSEVTTTTDSANAVEPSTAYTDFSVGFSHPLLRGAGTVAGMYGVLAARLGASDQELVWRGQVEQLVLDVSSAYWGLVSSRESAALAQRSVTLAEEQLSDVLERQGEGFAGSGDVLQVQRTLGASRQSLVVANADVEAAHDRLCRLLGISLDDEVQLDPTDRPQIPSVLPQRDAVLRTARDRNTSWRRAQLSESLGRLVLRRARNTVLPTLSLQAGFGLSGLSTSAALARQSTFTDLSPGWNVGVRLGMPIALRTRLAEFGSAKLTYAQQEQALEAASQDLTLSVDAGLRAVARDRARLELAESTLEYAQLGLEADRSLLRDGRGSTRDVVRSLESLREAQLGKLSAAIDLQTSLLNLARLEGTLLESMAVPVP